MAACIHAAARCSLFQCLVSVLLPFFFLLLVTYCQANNIYRRHDLLRIGVCSEGSVRTEFLHSLDILVEIARSPSSLWITIPVGRWRRRHKARKQKRGYSSGVLARLRKESVKPPLPSIFLSNSISLVNKMEVLRLQVTTHDITKDSCVILITESWLHASILDSAFQLRGYMLQCQCQCHSGKRQERLCVCVYVNNSKKKTPSHSSSIGTVWKGSQTSASQESTSGRTWPVERTLLS